MVQVLRGSTPIEIRTPPVIQVSLDVVVTLDSFFISNLIQNLAFVLRIEPSRIRVVEIIAEDSLKRRRSLLATDTINTVSLEFGDPPSMNVDPPEVTLVEDDWMENEGTSDSVDIEVRPSFIYYPDGYDICHDITIIYITVLLLWPQW